MRPLVDADAAVALAIAGSSATAPELRVVTVTSADPGDLTLNQLSALGRCDAVVIEGEVPAAVIDRARRDAVRLPAVPNPLPAGLTIVLRGV